jgi:3'(2'), 5'-bisphosphate nucleotidase
LKELLQPVIDIAKQAGSAIVDVAKSSEDMGIQKKADKTPVTIADLRAHEIIHEALTVLTPDIPVISEEGDEHSVERRLGWDRCWLVDPLDGTRGFIDGSGEYTVNIALIENHKPVMGVIYAPQIDEKLYYAVAGEGAFTVHQGQTAQIKIKPLDTSRTMNIAVSQYHRAKWLEELLADILKYELVRMNSSVKICFVAEGVADIYPRLGPTSEWDTAAGQCIVEEAGGAIVDLEGQSLTYNARTTLKNPGFIVIGDVEKQNYFLDLIQQVRREK